MAKKNQITTSDYLPYSEYQRLLDSLRQDKKYSWELYARLSFCTACRVSDVLSLRWSDVLNKSSLSIVEQKTGKTRVLQFNPSVREKLAEMYELLEQPDKDELIFVNPSTGRAITQQRINQKLKEFKQQYRLKIGNFSTHTFRKTFGRYVYDSRNRSAESLMLLNKIFNHVSMQVTKTYIGITQDEINDIYNSIKF